MTEIQEGEVFIVIQCDILSASALWASDTLSLYSNHSDRQKNAFVLLKLISELPLFTLVVLRSKDLRYELEGHFQNRTSSVEINERWCLKQFPTN